MTEYTYTWNVTNLRVYPQKQGQTNVVCDVGWNVLCVGDEFSAADMGGSHFEYDPATTPNFTPFEELTKEQVLGWVHEALQNEMVQKITGTDENGQMIIAEVSRYDWLLESLVNRIEEQKNPPVVSKPLPW